MNQPNFVVMSYELLQQKGSGIIITPVLTSIGMDQLHANRNTHGEVNNFFLSEGKSIFQLLFYNLGIPKVGCLVSKEDVFLKSDKSLNSPSSPCYSFALLGVFDAIPKEQHSIIKTNPYCAPSSMDQTCFEFIFLGKMIDLANVTSKMVYNEFAL